MRRRLFSLARVSCAVWVEANNHDGIEEMILWDCYRYLMRNEAQSPRQTVYVINEVKIRVLENLANE
jgi:hypothetical protein